MTPIAAIDKTQLYPIFYLPSMLQPYKFDGAKDLITTKEWLESIKCVIALFDMKDEERVRYATCFLKLSARIWCNLIKKITKVFEMSWSKFIRRFEAEYRGANATCIRV